MTVLFRVYIFAWRGSSLFWRVIAHNTYPTFDLPFLRLWQRKWVMGRALLALLDCNLASLTRKRSVKIASTWSSLSSASRSKSSNHTESIFIAFQVKIRRRSRKWRSMKGHEHWTLLGIDNFRECQTKAERKLPWNQVKEFNRSKTSRGCSLSQRLIDCEKSLKLNFYCNRFLTSQRCMLHNETARWKL